MNIFPWFYACLLAGLIIFEDTPTIEKQPLPSQAAYCEPIK